MTIEDTDAAIRAITAVTDTDGTTGTPITTNTGNTARVAAEGPEPVFGSSAASATFETRCSVRFRLPKPVVYCISQQSS